MTGWFESQARKAKDSAHLIPFPAQGQHTPFNRSQQALFQLLRLRSDDSAISIRYIAMRSMHTTTNRTSRRCTAVRRGWSRRRRGRKQSKSGRGRKTKRRRRWRRGMRRDAEEESAEEKSAETAASPAVAEAEEK